MDCRATHTFRLKSYSIERLQETVRQNLDCLLRILQYNRDHDLLFFRIGSQLVPFASHPVNQFDWQEYFAPRFQAIGRFAMEHEMRLSMHPDQFILINSPDEGVFERSVAELRYHVQVLDLMGLPPSAKVMIHVGGVYEDRQASLQRFITRYSLLEPAIRKRLAIENDDVSYPFADCLTLHQATGVPVVFDCFHHSILNQGESVAEVMPSFVATWEAQDGPPLSHYSSQQPDERTGKHADTIDLVDFERFLQVTKPYDLDIMLEVKDKEASALRAISVARNDERFVASRVATGP
jgi:UV DNA damage endonuclease